MQTAEPVFTTERLTIRPWTSSDVEAAFGIYSDPEVMATLNRAPVRDLEEQAQRLSAALAMNEALRGEYGYWAACLQETGEVVGAIILKPLPNSEKIEVGWHLARKHWGKGYATEGGAGAIRYGFERRRLETIYAITLPWNSKSIAVMERLGMRRLGLTREFHDLELALYAVDHP